ncbi:MAG: hypothetical protein ACXU81_08120 [Myxococcaceae bacterium]
MLVLRGEMLYDLEEASPEAPDGVAAIAGEQVREDPPVVERDEPPAEDEADGSAQRR